MRRLVLAGFVVSLAVATDLSAVTMQTFGPGSAVTSVDRSATFDALNYAGNGTPLSDYVTNGLSVRTNGNSYYGDNARGVINSNGVCFNPFHLTTAADHSYADVGGGFYFPYDGDFGNTDWVTIEAADGKKIFALEFLYGNGWTTGDIYGTQTGYPWGNSGAYLDWKTLVGGSVVSSGQVGISAYLGVGSVLGFSDTNAFDQLMVRAPHPNSVDPTLQELAIDNLNVQLTPVPEPVAISSLVLALPLMLRRSGRRGRRSSKSVA